MAGKNESKKADKRVFPRIETVPATPENLRKFWSSSRDLSAAMKKPEFWIQRMRADAIRALQFANTEFPAEYSESDLRLAAASSESLLYAVQALRHLDNTQRLLSEIQTRLNDESELSSHIISLICATLAAGDSLVSSALISHESQIWEGEKNENARVKKNATAKRRLLQDLIDYENQPDTKTHLDRIRELQQKEWNSNLETKTLMNKIPKNPKARAKLRAELESKLKV